MGNDMYRIDKRVSIDELLARGNMVIDMSPSEMSKDTKEEAAYHASQRETWVEQAQIDSYRNLFYHEQIISQICLSTNQHTAVLELAGGVGFDLNLFLEKQREFGCYVFSDISVDLLSYAKRNLWPYSQQKVVFCCIDANDILINDRQVDIVYMIAALHHFNDIEKAISEIDRVAKKGATIIFGIEPNVFWSAIMKVLIKIGRLIFERRSHSPADEKSEGFSIKSFHEIATIRGWKLDKIIPVWFFTGLLHYGLDGLYRAFRLNKRVRVPLWLEKVFVTGDQLLFRFPGMKRLVFHYTVIYKKR